MRRSPNRALEQVSDLALQDAVGRQPDCITHPLGFEELIDLGVGEGRITSEIQPLHDAAVAGDHWLQHYAPAISAMDLTRSQSAPLNIAELVEHEQWVIAGAGEMAVVGAAFLVAVGRALARIRVEHYWCTLSIHWPGRSARATRFSGRLSHFVSKRPIWLAEAAEPAIAWWPTTQRIAGSRHSRSASFTSS
jgi:hypothetical protein